MNRMRMMIGMVGSLTLVSGMHLVGGDSREQLMQHFVLAAGRESFKTFLPLLKVNLVKITAAANMFNHELSDQEKDKLLLKLFEIAVVNKIKEHELPTSQKSLILLRTLCVVNNAVDVMEHYVMVKGSAEPFTHMEHYIDDKLQREHGDSFVALKTEVARHNKKLKADAVKNENSNTREAYPKNRQPMTYSFSKLSQE